MKKLIIVADDFGLTEETSKGIIEGHASGLITSTALLTNGLYTREAIELSKKYPDLEVGLHLSFVEGVCLTSSPDLFSSKNYFPGKQCLHENWKDFLSAYLKGKIKLSSLEKELDTQICFFKDQMGSIPFLNSTQHIHLFPPFHDLIIKLCKRHSIKKLRIPQLNKSLSLSLRSMQFWLLKSFAKTLLRRAKSAGLALQSPDEFLGFEQGGALNKKALLSLVKQVSPGITEVMCHPGYYSDFLKTNIIGYKDYNWQSELEALTDLEIIDEIKKQNIKLCKFSEAFNPAKVELKE